MNIYIPELKELLNRGQLPYSVYAFEVKVLPATHRLPRRLRFTDLGNGETTVRQLSSRHALHEAMEYFKQSHYTVVSVSHDEGNGKFYFTTLESNSPFVKQLKA